MSLTGWTPLIVTGAGLLVGLVLSWRFLRGASKTERSDLVLLREDLIQERDEAYERLRNGNLDESDRRRLETRAASILKKLDEIGHVPAPKKKKPAADAAAQPATFGARHPMLMGSLLGGGMVGLVALLIYWAQRDARPDPTANQEQAAPMAQDNGVDRGEPPLPPVVAAQVEQLRGRVASNPDDHQLRTELGQLLLSHGQFFAAFNEAQTVLQAEPANAGANYISGVVRYTMGQAQPALEHLGAALQANPAYSPAAMVKGLIEIQTGERDVAIATWEAGLNGAGGSDSRLQHLLGMARDGKTAEEILATPPP